MAKLDEILDLSGRASAAEDTACARRVAEVSDGSG